MKPMVKGNAISFAGAVGNRSSPVQLLYQDSRQFIVEAQSVGARHALPLPYAEQILTVLQN